MPDVVMHGPATIFTLGHSTRTLDELLDIVRAHHVSAIADVRRYPGSRRLPWFKAENLAEALPQSGIQYWPFPDLGGRRQPTPNSPNAGWRNGAFRGYADYMRMPPFIDALERLMRMARRMPTAMMCAEAVPWRCHRSLIADALLVRGWNVRDIFDARKATEHKLTPFAKVQGSDILYPPADHDAGTLWNTDGRQPVPSI